MVCLASFFPFAEDIVSDPPGCKGGCKGGAPIKSGEGEGFHDLKSLLGEQEIFLLCCSEKKERPNEELFVFWQTLFCGCQKKTCKPRRTGTVVQPSDCSAARSMATPRG
jgi:hypothetical protein